MSSIAPQALACWRTVWWLFLTAVPFKLMNDGAQFVGPFFLNKLLDVIEVGGSQVTIIAVQGHGRDVIRRAQQEA